MLREAGGRGNNVRLFGPFRLDVGATSTQRVESANRRLATLPSGTARVAPRCPLRPTTIISAPYSVATFKIFSHGGPRRTKGTTWIPRRIAPDAAISWASCPRNLEVGSAGAFAPGSSS
jgi:hypothetical protein